MLRFVDGFSHYTQAFLPDKWDVVPAIDALDTFQTRVMSVSGVGRFGGGGIAFTGPLGTLVTCNDAMGTSPCYIQKNYDGQSTIYVGLAVQQTATQCVYGGRLLTFMDGSTVQVGLDIMQSGQIRAVRSHDAGLGFYLRTTGTTAPWYDVLATSTSAISSSSFDFLEVKIIHHPSAGEILINRNGSEFWHATGLNTAISGANNSSSVIVGGYLLRTASFLAEVHCLNAVVTDFHVLDEVVDGSDALNPVTFIGDRHWEPITPTADGADTAWTTTGSVNHFANVDEVPPNTTDFNSSGTVGQRDGFIVSSPTGPSSATVLISLTMYCQKNAGGSNEIKGFIRSPTPTYRNGTAFQVPSPWGFRQSFLCSKPGGGAITIADVNADQLGYEKTV